MTLLRQAPHAGVVGRRLGLSAPGLFLKALLISRCSEAADELADMEFPGDFNHRPAGPLGRT